MRLLMNIIMRPLSASLFLHKFVSGARYSTKLESKQQRRQRSTINQNLLSGGPDSLDQIASTLASRLRFLTEFQDSLAQSFYDWLCRSKGRSRLLKSKLMKQQYVAQLDVRRLIANSISLRDFLRSFLTPAQQALLAHQRSRFASFKKDADSASKSLDDETFERFDPEAVQQILTQQLDLDSRLDRNLVRGVLYRKGSLSRKRNPEAPSHMPLRSRMQVHPMPQQIFTTTEALQSYTRESIEVDQFKF